VPCSALAEPYRDRARGGLSGAGVDLGLGKRAQRVIDHDRREVGHAERVALHLRLVQEFGGDDDRGRPSQRFELDAVMRTARRARPSIADRGQDDVVIGGDRGEQRWIGILREALLAVVIDRRE
jgi:hypothetical protein